jgi:hypothetical protein
MSGIPINIRDLITIRDFSTKDVGGNKRLDLGMVQLKAHEIYQQCISGTTLTYETEKKEFKLSLADRFFLWISDLCGSDILQDIQKILTQCLPKEAAPAPKQAAPAPKSTPLKRKNLKAEPKMPVAVAAEPQKPAAVPVAVPVAAEPQKPDDAPVLPPGQSQQIIALRKALGRKKKESTDQQKQETIFDYDMTAIETKIANCAAVASDPTWFGTDKNARLVKCGKFAILTLSDPTGILKAPKSYQIPLIERTVTTKERKEIESGRDFDKLEAARNKVFQHRLPKK